MKILGKELSKELEKQYDYLLKNIENTRFEVEQLEKVDIYIQNIPKKRKTINKNINSYNLKHRVERYLRKNNFPESNYISMEAVNLVMELYGFKKQERREYYSANSGKDNKLNRYYCFNIRNSVKDNLF